MFTKATIHDLCLPNEGVVHNLVRLRPDGAAEQASESIIPRITWPPGFDLERPNNKKPLNCQAARGVTARRQGVHRGPNVTCNLGTCPDQQGQGKGRRLNVRPGPG